jgi:hypothetical protein
MTDDKLSPHSGETMDPNGHLMAVDQPLNKDDPPSRLPVSTCVT